MMGQKGGKAEALHVSTEETGSARSDLQMTPERMLDLARKAAELVVERVQNLPEENAWEGNSNRN